MMLPQILDIASLKAAYASGLPLLDLVEEVTTRMEASEDPAVFITPISADDLRAAAKALLARAPEPNSLPLWGIPFAVKDNIDVSGFPTTAACPAFAYQPERDATVVARLKAAGALVIGKTNLDQFATGLNGTRSPYGAPRSVFDSAYVSGGSSSGSAVAVASGLASFSLGTDTAGSGRVPAAFNNLVGVKPTPGLVPNVGVVPACRSVDVVTVFAATVGDATSVRKVMDGYEAQDPFSERLNQPPCPLPDFGSAFSMAPNANSSAIPRSKLCTTPPSKRAKSLGATIVPFDYAPFRQAAELLYNGPWVAERLAAVKDFISSNADDVDPTVRKIIEGAKAYSAVDAFEGLYKLGALGQKARAEWEKLDILMLPTSPTTYTVEDMQADPIVKNSHFGRYTNFANLFGYAAIAVPAGFDSKGHLPAGVTLFGPGFSDDALAPFADAMHRALGAGMGKDRHAALPEASKVASPASNWAQIVVVGAHLTGMPLNHELTGPGGRLVKACKTAGDYRLYVLPNTTPPKPGLIRDPGFSGGGLDVEVWSIPYDAFGRFVANIPSPLGIGKVTLEEGSQVSGFLCEPFAVQGAREVTDLGGWRAYIASLKT
ncbi:allophanate hydrolase [Rhizobium sp. G21]|uniref:allophanate hydrolase n=1 Tax=Rhizobium sp. G21 TaxID=2758439 RepID=UPI001601CDBF|nr:allophanate hydrolase [Rhizobium sp. G21]MBB1251380.1 allophanate hydrolase [Rhizobium sp. G21]